MISFRYLFFITIIIFALITPGCSSPEIKNSVNTFDSKNAFTHMQNQVDFGPRFPGSTGHVKLSEYIVTELEKLNLTVKKQSFALTIGKHDLKLTNIISAINPDAKRWILVSAHWDTRPIADMEIDPAKRLKPISGANDGASGTAILLELARMFSNKKPNVGVLLVFFDGEDYGTSEDEMFLGSRYFANNINNIVIKDKKIKIDYGILLDMVGDKNLNIYKEGNSIKSAPEIVEKVWIAAKNMGYSKEFNESVKYNITDDHIPLINAGIKCIDIIDFDYGPWHTLDDTIDKCSADSLDKVGNVIAKVIYDEK